MLHRFKLAGFVSIAATLVLFASAPASAHKLRERNEPVEVAKSGMIVVPGRDWNLLTSRPGKNAEVWTLDSPQLNEVTFFGGIGYGEPLIKERSKKRDPLPKFTRSTLLIEIPELLEGTHRSAKGIGDFEVIHIDAAPFLGNDGVNFRYKYVDEDQLPRLGEARAAIVDGKLYMISFEAPRIHFYERNLADFQALAESARLK